MNGFDNGTQEYVAQNMNFVQLRGKGRTAALAEADLHDRTFSLISAMLDNGDTIPIPAPIADREGFKMWNAAYESFFDAMEAEGYPVPLEARESVLTLAAHISRLIKSGKKATKPKKSKKASA
jgi:hypothetical protein